MGWKKTNILSFPLTLEEDYYTIKTKDGSDIYNEELEIIKGLPIRDGLVTWFEEKVETVDGRVTKWLDISGSGNHATQTIEARQPTKLDVGINFDGIKGLVTEHILDGNSDFTLIIVADGSENTASTGSLGGIASSDSSSLYHYFNFNASFLRNNNSSTVPVRGYPIMGSMIKNNFSTVVYNVSEGTETPALIVSESSLDFRQGFGYSPRSSPTLHRKGIIYASVLYNRALSKAEQEVVYDYFKATLKDKGVNI